MAPWIMTVRGKKHLPTAATERIRSPLCAPKWRSSAADRPAFCCPISCTATASTASCWSGRPAPTCWSGFAPACSRPARLRCCARSGSARGWIAKGIRTTARAIAWEGRPRFFIDTKKYTGKPMMAYGQTAITEDLYAARDAADGKIVDEAADVRLHELTSDRPYVTYEKDGARMRVDCDYIAGCDGYHGVSRTAIPADVLKTYEKSYPFGWLGIMSETPPYPDICYCYHSRGFALASHAQSDAQPLLHPVRPRRPNWTTGRTSASGRNLRRAARRTWRTASSPGRRSKNPSRRCAASSPSRCATAAVPRRRRRPHRAADRREGAQPRGVGRVLSVARADRSLPQRQKALSRLAIPIWRCAGFGRPRACRGG